MSQSVCPRILHPLTALQCHFKTHSCRSCRCNRVEMHFQIFCFDFDAMSFSLQSKLLKGEKNLSLTQIFNSIFFLSAYFTRVHIIKATQYTRLKATPKNTGKKATKIYRNIGYNEYTGLKATAFLNTQEKRLHFLNIQEKRLHFLNIQEKGYTF